MTSSPEPTVSGSPRAENSERRPARKPAWRRLLPLIILVGLVALAFWSGLDDYFSLRQVAENRAALTGFVRENYLLAILAYTCLYVAVTALSLPAGALLTITGGFLFGPIVGGTATVVGATFGATIIYLIARSSLGEPLAARAGPWLAKLRKGFQEDAMSYLLFLRLVPAFPFAVVNLVPAFLGVSLRTYVVGTFFGIIPGTFAFAWLGAGLDSIIEVQQEAYRQCVAEKGAGAACRFELDPGALLTNEIIIAFVALGVVALIPPLLRRWRNGRAA